MTSAAGNPRERGADSPPPRGRSIGLVLVDDHPAVRRGLAALLEGEDDLRVLAAADSAQEGLAAIERLDPDLALLDYHLAGENGLSICLRTRGPARRPRVLVCSAFADAPLALQAIVAGAEGMVSKDRAPAELFAAIRAVARGEPWLPPLSPQVLQAQGARLAPEDLPVVAMLREGVPEEEIATTLGLDVASLRARRWAILGRLSARGERPARPLRRAHSSMPSPPGRELAWRSSRSSAEG